MNPYSTPKLKPDAPCQGQPERKIDYDSQQARQSFEQEQEERRERFAEPVIENPELIAIKVERQKLFAVRVPLQREWNHAMRIVRTIGDGMPRFSGVKDAAERELRKIESELAPIDMRLKELQAKEELKTLRETP